MNIALKFFALSVVFVCPSLTVSAYNPSVNIPAAPYEVYVADSNIKERAEYLGKLEGEPHMYEFTTGAAATLKLQISQLKTDSPAPFSLIAVKENMQNAGVVEVGRLRFKDIEWQKERDGVLGLSFLRSQAFKAEIGPGIYRVEVSTPENFGSYMLTIGEQPVDPGYFKTLGDIYSVQSFFGKSILSLLLSSYVYYPIGIVILSWLLYVTWRNRQKIQSKYA